MSVVDAVKRNDQERQAMEVAEEAREAQWQHPSFCAELFAGNFRFDLLYPFPEQDAEDKRKGSDYIQKIMRFLQETHDPSETDRTGDIKKEVYEGLAKLGAFGLKIPTEYGGMGFSQTNYNRIIHAVSSYCASVGVLLSAHQSIGVPQPLKMFGTPEQKKKYLPRLAAGEISAFALTEPGVGSDPARMTTTATPSDDGNFYTINGEKLWCTNGAIADILVVMAMTPSIKLPNGKEKKQITAFIVEKNTPGFEILHRCRFMGLSGIQNALIRFTNVKVPKENILWGVGKGLKLALITLNTGRLTIPGAASGGGRACFAMSKTWGKEREQWGAPIGEHEASANKVSFTAGATYALDAVGKMTSGMADAGDADIRIEAAIAKLFSTGVLWRVIDNALQLRGGRGYETSESLRARGEDAYAIERMMRDTRINMIIEGTSDIQRLFVSREALDRHLKLAGALFNPKAGVGEKLGALVKAGFYYAYWYPAQWLHLGYFPRYAWAGSWEGSYLRFVHRMSSKLARSTFHAMVLNGPKLEKRQMLLGKIVDTGTALFVLATTLSRYLTRKKNGLANKREDQLVRMVCEVLKQEAKSTYHQINPLPKKSELIELSKAAMNGELDWLIEDIVDVVGQAKANKGTPTGIKIEPFSGKKTG